MRHISLFAIVLALMAAACTPEAGFEARIETIDGVEWIHNPTSPQFPERSLTLEADLTLEGRDGDGNIILFRPSRFRVGLDDDFYVLDYEDQTVKIFDRDGVYLRSFGGKGEGPGEFQNVIDMDILPDGRFIFLDTATRRTSLFDPQGIFLKSHQWRGFRMDILLPGEEYYIVDETVFMQPPHYTVKKIDLEGSEVLSFGEFTPLGIRIVREGETTYSLVVPALPSSKFASDPQRQRLYHCLNEQYLIEVFDAEGRLFRKIQRPYSPVPFTQEDADKFYASHDRNADKMYGKLARQVELPRVKTVTDLMLVDDAGNLWIQTQENREEGDRVFTAYDIFDPDGSYAFRVWLSVAPSLIVGKKIYTLETDDEGYRTVKRYRMAWLD
ncbi:MAG: 6-bladed beta-propeller [Candidatus Aminicenantaceae bacterium]